MKNIIFLIFALFIFNSCSDELITIVDEYNPPYEVKAIPNGDGTVSISFWSGVLANDFAGFNLYASATRDFTNALTGLDGGYPTVRETTHTRTNFTLSFSTYTSFNFTSGGNTLYYIGVTAYGTNELAEGGKIETKVVAIPVVPRGEQQNNSQTGTITVGSLTVNVTATTISGGQARDCGYRTNFNEITAFTNNSLSSGSLTRSTGHLYVFSNGSYLAKVWITSSGYTYATHSHGNVCNTI